MLPKGYVFNFSFLTFPDFSCVVFFLYFSGTEICNKQTFYAHFWFCKTVGGTKKKAQKVKNIEKMPFLSQFIQKTRKNSFLI